MGKIPWIPRVYGFPGDRKFLLVGPWETTGTATKDLSLTEYCGAEPGFIICRPPYE